MTYSGDKEKRAELQQDIKSNDEFHILLTTYEVLDIVCSSEHIEWLHFQLRCALHFVSVSCFVVSPNTNSPWWYITLFSPESVSKYGFGRVTPINSVE